MKRTAIVASLLASIALFATSALAADVKITNNAGTRLAVAVAYTDASSGVMVTEGWRHVDSGATLTITVPADESKTIYYAAYNDSQYYGPSRKGAIRRWMSSHHFKYATDSDPQPTNDPTVWQGKMFPVEGSVTVR